MFQVLKVNMPGGWAAYEDNSTLSHYGSTWRDHLHQLADDAIVLDFSEVSYDEKAELSIMGPLVNTQIAPGRMRVFGVGDAVFSDEPRLEKYPRLGSAGGFDYVAPDVYATIATRYGAKQFTGAEVKQNPDLIPNRRLTQ